MTVSQTWSGAVAVQVRLKRGFTLTWSTAAMPPSQPWTAPLAPLASEEDRAGARLAGGRGRGVGHFTRARLPGITRREPAVS